MKSAGVQMIILLFLCVSIALVIDKNKEKEEIAAEPTKTYLELENVEEMDFKNKAVLFMDEDYDAEAVEKKLHRISKDYNIEISKVFYGDKVEQFSENQEELIAKYYPPIAEIVNQLLTKEVNGQMTFNEDLSEKVNSILTSFLDGEDIEPAIQEVAKETGMNEEDIRLYFTNRAELSRVVIEKPIIEEDGPTLVMFNSEKEYGRVSLLETENTVLEWLLVNKGLLNLNRDNSAEKALEGVAKEGDVVISFGSNTCVFCGNTSQLVKEIAEEKEISYFYIDASTFVNEVNLPEITSKHLTAEVEKTPTVVYLRDGKELNRFVGQQDYYIIEKFLRDNQTTDVPNPTEDSKSTDVNVQPTNVKE